MSLPHNVRYLKTAQKDLGEIFAYIVKDNPGAAAVLLENFDHSISQLGFHPALGRVPRDDRLKKLGYRMLVVQRYLVFYVVKKRTVQIRRIIHGARKYNFLL
ncbi:MAG: type II toxin-antitoxin system RelE/ParE family toxin [Deltaproteobacteria bacterium]|nr:type II toxin-antitoxin system RelE/ParE family toxin [Deltaproteobacteria bacterium]MBW2178140.1 type II toxin-antitoxin system RelE/ParE family toxin [Deltaproteobacteria bacterium]